MNFKYTFLGLLFLTSLTPILSQQQDTGKTIQLTDVEILITKEKPNILRLTDIQETSIFSGKKNEVIVLENSQADLSSNNARQIFAKVPGISVWENDGSGIQTSIASRGLSPNRSWEFNMRQNGYDIAAEAFGYPESYYTPPTEAVSKIEIVRGAASLQYGTQFGGLVNYVIKKGDTSKPIVVESSQTKGSYGLFNSYNAVGGTYKKLSYYTYFHHRSANGWRMNSQYNTNTAYASMNYAINSKCNIGFEYTHMNFESQQPGGLNDALLLSNTLQSNRSRNWLTAPWNVAALTFDYQLNEDEKLSMKVFGTMAERNSVGFTKSILVADTFNSKINSFNPRQVDRENYTNIGTELRYLKSYQLLNQKSTLAIGVRVYKGDTKRLQNGIGTVGSNLDINITSFTNGKAWGRDLNFRTNNFAVFAENLFKIGKALSVTPGVRYENIFSTSKGYINPNSDGTIKPTNQQRHVFLMGLGAEYQTSSTTNVYANYSQSFRPVTFSELTPSATSDIIDPNLKDAKGFNLDGGFRGSIKNYLNFDIGGFYLLYDNRIGVISQNNVAFKTNIGTSVSKGIESFVEFNPLKIFSQNSKVGYLTFFVSYAYVDAKYTQWNNPAIENDASKSIKNKRVENAPQNIARYGLTYNFKTLVATFQLNKVSDVFTDAANTIAENNIATIGKIKGYQVMDLNLSYAFSHQYMLKAGVNNLTNEVYATRRSGGYPGPGLLPGIGRNFYVTFGIKI
jgi:Fe(3+) dicitrate transport protein